MADLRDRVALTTPIIRTTLKGWLIQKEVTVDLASRDVTCFIRYYDSAGNVVASEQAKGRISRNRRDNMVADLVADIVAQRPDLAGVLTVETVSDSTNDPVANP